VSPEMVHSKTQGKISTLTAPKGPLFPSAVSEKA
jgi:hypothetical protein